jgi:hypothetical protein
LGRNGIQGVVEPILHPKPRLLVLVVAQETVITLAAGGLGRRLGDER